MELRRVEHHDIATLRAEKRLHYHVPLLPEFHVRLASHSEAWELRDGTHQVGYALALRDAHEGHEHVTLVEMYLTAPYRDRYEDAVDAVRDTLEPRVYLARSDECVYETALLTRGYQMEVSLALMAARAVLPAEAAHGLGLVPLDYPHLRAAHDLYLHVRGVEQAPTHSELEQLIDSDRVWVLTDHDRPIALTVREAGEPGSRYCLVDILAPHVGDEAQVWALLTIGRIIEGDGLTSAAIVDMRDVRKLEVFRAAGYFTPAIYLIFYDPEAGRPSVPLISRDDLWDLVESGEPFHLVDVLGEDHWSRGHLPGAVWVDFRSLTREARKRFGKDEKIVVYCNDYT